MTEVVEAEVIAVAEEVELIVMAVEEMLVIEPVEEEIGGIVLMLVTEVLLYTAQRIKLKVVVLVELIEELEIHLVVLEEELPLVIAVVLEIVVTEVLGEKIIMIIVVLDEIMGFMSI